MASIAAVAALAAGCADKRGGPIPYGVANFGTPDSTAVAALGADYKIAPMDTLSVTVFRVPDLTGEYAVDLLGQISIPLVGDVLAADRTPEELDRVLTAKLGEKYFVNPDVSVGIKASAGRLVTVDGAVNKAGTYPVVGPLTLMQAVALAGGADEEANLRRVAVFRKIGGQRQAAAFDLVSIRRGETPDPALYAGDIVVVDGSSIKATQKRILQGLPILSIFRPLML
ncbi:MAG: polysaccharide export protein [Pseudomonadota bacterium]|nr:polysaccharide export protein [Sphingomonas sp.]MDQ3477835.1 polysaccharide export protein [Pseudomonadota bacterium]